MKAHIWSRLLVAALGVSGMSAASVADAAEARQERAGKLADGTEIVAITLKARNGVSARILSDCRVAP